MHILLCFSSSEDLRGELEKEEKGMMVVVIVSSHYLAMWRIHSLTMTISLGFVHGWFLLPAYLCLLLSASSSLPPQFWFPQAAVGPVGL